MYGFFPNILENICFLKHNSLLCLHEHVFAPTKPCFPDELKVWKQWLRGLVTGAMLTGPKPLLTSILSFKPRTALFCGRGN